MGPKTFHFEADTEGLSINDISALHYNIFVAKHYDWWYEVLPGDVVVDIGASIGLFSAKALDAKAKRVYMIEPNKVLLRTAIKNVSDHIMDVTESPVVPINVAIGKTDVDLSNIYVSRKSNPIDEEPRLMAFREFCDLYKVDYIDYLKICAVGAEYNILTKDNLEFISTQVRHTAVMVHLKAQYGWETKFENWRDNFLKPLIDLNRVRFQDSSTKEKIFKSNYVELLPSQFMVYITNW